MRRKSLCPSFEEMKCAPVTILMLLCLTAPCSAFKVGICVFGLTRSLQWTINNIRSNILDAIHAEGLEYEVYLHTYAARQYTNPVMGEINVQLHWQKFSLLQPKSYKIDPLQDVDQLLFPGGEIDEYLTFDGRSEWHGNNPGEMTLPENITVKNHVKALWSAYQCTRLVQASLQKPDALLWLRSDLWFFRPINASIFSALQANTLYVPDWCHFGGLNDRFALGLLDPGLQWGNRFQVLKDFCKSHRIHSEQFLAWAMAEKQVDTSGRVDILFERVRANGLMKCCDKGPDQPCEPWEACYYDVPRQRQYKAVLNNLNFVEMKEVKDEMDRPAQH